MSEVTEVDISSSAAEDDAETFPSQLPVLPLRSSVAQPETVMPLAIGQPRSIEMVTDVLAGDRLLMMVAARNDENPEPGPDELYDIGVVGTVARMVKMPDGSLRILVQGAGRARVTGWTATDPYLVATLEELPDIVDRSPALTALMRNVQTTFGHVIELSNQLPDELGVAINGIEDPVELSHLISGSLRIDPAQRQELLEQTDVGVRLRRLSELLAHEVEVLTIGSEIQSQVQSEIDKGQREFLLRQQLKAIQTELGDFDESAEEARELRDTLAALPLPETVRTVADRELGRLERVPVQASEHGVIRSYLEWIAALPWGVGSVDNLDLAHAREILDSDHYGLEDVKDRILEMLAVRKLNAARDMATHGTILCLVGPPGVGKTSLGNSIAKALGRGFERMSVGGVRDEAEIRGHRRTYVGAMPGTLIRAMRDAGTTNPLILVDEIDKMGSGMRGDPSSAMLEVLDPEQNATFRDHYLDVPYDLSQVLFVCTANDIEQISGPLRDRMEIVAIAGYTDEEKLEIARTYLWPRQRERAGLRKSWAQIGAPALRAVISGYTREAGVRQLERALGTICRKLALRVAELPEDEKPQRTTVSAALVGEMLGPTVFKDEVRRRTRRPGVATGLAWTPVGGTILFVEVTAMAGRGRLQLTGKLGGVMRESAQAALSYVKANIDRLAPELKDDWFATHDLHVHVPAGATPKDGPSAGITIVTALVSLVTGRRVRDDVAMTGEVTLTGEILPIGGLKEKALAARRAGIKIVIAPAGNGRDREKMPGDLVDEVEFFWPERVDEVLDIALTKRARKVTAPN